MTPAVDHADAKRRAEHFVASPSFWGLEEPIDIVSRAYLSLLGAVEPLLAAAEKATPGPWTWNKDEPWIIAPGRESTLKPWFIAEPWEHGIYEMEGEDDATAAFIVAARNTADALRDLLGPTGGQA